MLRRTRWGYEIKLIGDSPRAARYAGIDIGRMTIVVFAISGGMAGLAGVSEVAGVVHRLQGAISPGYGFTAIIVAYLAKFDPIKVIVAAIAFGALTLAGREIQPAGIPAMIQGILLFALIGSEVLLRYRVRFVRRTSLMDPTTVLAAGIATGTILLFAAVGEIFAERSGVLNLGVEGMMLMGAVVGYGGRGRDRRPVARADPGDGRRHAPEPAPRRHGHHLPGRPGRVRPVTDLPRDGAGPGHG